MLGSPSELRIRFDQGYTLMIAASVDQQDATHKLILSLAPKAALRDAINGVRIYQVAKGEGRSPPSEGIEAKKRARHPGLGPPQTSLEEVFLTIVGQSAVEQRAEVGKTKSVL